MTTNKELEARIDSLTRLLAQQGIMAPDDAPFSSGSDFIEHGSAEHAVFLGLVLVDGDDSTERIATYASPRSDRVFALEDELAALQHFVGVAPEKAVRLFLQQKVNELELAPTVPENAPAMFQPTVVYG